MFLLNVDFEFDIYVRAFAKFRTDHNYFSITVIALILQPSLLFEIVGLLLLIGLLLMDAAFRLLTSCGNIQMTLSTNLVDI